jgi:hypothetical protein
LITRGLSPRGATLGGAAAAAAAATTTGGGELDELVDGSSFFPKPDLLGFGGFSFFFLASFPLIVKYYLSSENKNLNRKFFLNGTFFLAAIKASLVAQGFFFW